MFIAASLLLMLALSSGQPRSVAAAPGRPQAVTAPPYAGVPSAGIQPTLLVYSSVQELLAGDLVHTVSLATVQNALGSYPADWPVVGLGTTNQAFRTGELMPDGLAGAVRFWWADPSSASQADVIDLSTIPSPPALPFIALAVGDPARALTWSLDSVDDVHAWLVDHLVAAGIPLAGIQLQGSFGAVNTTVSYNLPRTGLDTSGGYVGTAYFRFNNYAAATWTMNGVYAAPAPLQALVASGGPLHLHGYQPNTMLGGHITKAAAISVTATIWPLDQLVDRRGVLSAP